MSKYEIPAEFQDGLKIKSNTDGIKLPFAAPLIYWRNGDPALKNMNEIKDARRFGGWGVGKEEMDELKIPVAPSWQLFNLTNTKGKEFDAYLFRTVWAARIDRRIKWEVTERGSNRSTVNHLVYLALRNDKGEFLPYGPAVLKGQSYTGKAIDDCFKKFDTETEKLRDGALPNLFFCPIGTFGDFPVLKSNASKDGKNESTVTDPMLYIPDGGYTEAFMDKVFVANVAPEIMADMANYKRQAAEWLAEWNKPKAQNQHEPTAEEIYP